MLSLYREEILDKLAGDFSQRPEIRFAYLFGSLAKGTQNKLSDVDIGAFLDDCAFQLGIYPYGYKAYLITELIRLLKTKRVDVVILNGASPLLKFQVVRYGVPIYEADPQERILFQANAFSRYFDLQPVLKVHLSQKIFK